MSLTEKGITAFPSNGTVPAELGIWLQQLQLRFPKISTYTPTIDLGAVGATSYSTQTFTVSGLNTQDVITVNPPALTAGLYLISSRVSAADTVSLTFYNSTGGSINEPVAIFKIVAVRL